MRLATVQTHSTNLQVSKSDFIYLSLACYKFVQLGLWFSLVPNPLKKIQGSGDFWGCAKSCSPHMLQHTCFVEFTQTFVCRSTILIWLTALHKVTWLLWHRVFWLAFINMLSQHNHPHFFQREGSGHETSVIWQWAWCCLRLLLYNDLIILLW